MKMKKLKDIVVNKVGPPAKFGTNPMEPWSTRANIYEGRGWLDRYLAAKGLDPRFVTPNQKVSYAKSGDFLKWKNDRILRGESLENFEDDIINEDLRKWFKQKWVRMDTKGNIKGQCARDPGEGKPKCLPAAKAAALGKDKRAAAARRKRREDPNPERRGAPINVRTEDVFSDTYAATQTTPNVQDVIDNRKKEMSKSARIIKSIYKKKQMKEDMYDWEKEDKSVKTYGKKPKMQSLESENGRKPPAAAVVSGGKTLTGVDRDDIQIDPMLKMRPPGQTDFDSQVAKKKY
jgi:hypothetical protein